MINSTTKQRTFKHLSPEQRGAIQVLHMQGVSQNKIAKLLGVNQSTISRELKRGRVQQMNSQHEYYDCYLATRGSDVYHENRSNCVAKGALSRCSQNFINELVEALKAPAKERLFSVDTFVHNYQREHVVEYVPCTKTVYKLIDQGVLPVRNIDLPMKTRLRPRKDNKSLPKGHNKRVLGRSIETRCESILTQAEFGHWELDLVLGKKTKGEPCVITLIERKTKKLLTHKIWKRDAKSVKTAVLNMVLKEGKERFKTMTTDNGSEFADLASLEEELTETLIYFTHAYAAWEKGINERHNRILREFLPKGMTMKDLTYRELAHYTDVMNRRCKRSLGYRNPNECYAEEVAQLALNLAAKNKAPEAV